MAKATTARGRKMSTETEMEVEDPTVLMAAAGHSSGTWDVALGLPAKVNSRKHWKGWHSYQKPNHPLSGKQILNFANPEQNTKVQRNKINTKEMRESICGIKSRLV